MVRLVNGNLLPMVQLHQTEIEVVVSASLQKLNHRVAGKGGQGRKTTGTVTGISWYITVNHGVSSCVQPLVFARNTRVFWWNYFLLSL